MLPWSVLDSILVCFSSNVFFVRLVRLVPEFNTFPNRHVCPLYPSCHLDFTHIRPTPSFNLKIMIFVKDIKCIISVVIVIIRHRSRWVLAVMRFMRYIMTLIHFHRLPYVSNS